MPPFSDRMGITRSREIVQLNDADERLRIALYNVVHDAIKDRWYTVHGDHGGNGFWAARRIWTDFWYQPSMSFPGDISEISPIACGQ